MADNADGWNIIGEQRGFYDEQDCLRPSRNLVSENLRNGREDDVVIFDYSLGPGYLQRIDGDTVVGQDGSSSEHSSADDDIFFLVSKDRLIESQQFNKIINLANEPARGQRLGIM